MKTKLKLSKKEQEELEHLDKCSVVLSISEVRLSYCYFIKYEPRQPAFYFLTNKGAIVYIGYSGHVWSRLRDHMQQGKEWDGVVFGRCISKEVARSYEQRFLSQIDKLPKYNRSRTH